MSSGFAPATPDPRNMLALDTRNAALLRMALGLLVMYDVVDRLAHLTDFYQGIYPLWLGREHLPGLSVYYSLPPAWLLPGLALTAVAAAGLAVGWRTRACAALTFLLVLSLQVRASWALDVGDSALRCLLFWALWLPLGERWSVDAWVGRGARARRVFSLATLGLSLQAAGIFLFAGLSKFRSYEWVSGQAVAQALAGDTWTHPAGRWLYLYPTLLTILTWLTLLVEVGAPWLLLWPWQRGTARRVGLAILTGFTMGLGVTIQLGLIPWVLLSALLVFVPLPGQPPLTRQSRPVNLVSGLALLVMLVTNLHHVVSPNPLPEPWRGWLRMILADQSWTMYMPPYSENYRVNFKFSTGLGELHTVGLGATRPDWPALESFPPTERLWHNYRTRVYLYDSIAFEGCDRELAVLADWFRARWNAAHPPEQAVADLQIVKERRRPWPPGHDPTRPLQPLEANIVLYPR